jgi:hypothetical protein
VHALARYRRHLIGCARIAFRKIEHVLAIGIIADALSFLGELGSTAAPRAKLPLTNINAE